MRLATLDAAVLETLLMRELHGDWRNPEVRFRQLQRSYGSLVERTGCVLTL